MDCNQCKEEMSLLLTGYIDSTKYSELLRHIESCPDCTAEFDTLQRLWNMMGEMPVPSPSPSMQQNFELMLHDFQQQPLPRKNPFGILGEKWKDLWKFHPVWQFAYSMILILVGLGVGYFSEHNKESGIVQNRQIDSLSSQVSEMKQMFMLSLLENPSASERLRAVSYSEQIPMMNRKVIDALLTTLNEDDNVNVRLVTLETLIKFASNASVREGLVQSILHQESPLMQSAIADAMVKLQEKKSIRSLQILLNRKGLNNMVRAKIEQSIHRLT